MPWLWLPAAIVSIALAVNAQALSPVELNLNCIQTAVCQHDYRIIVLPPDAVRVCVLFSLKRDSAI